MKISGTSQREETVVVDVTIEELREFIESKFGHRVSFDSGFVFAGCWADDTLPVSEKISIHFSKKTQGGWTT